MHYQGGGQYSLGMRLRLLAAWLDLTVAQPSNKWAIIVVGVPSLWLER